MTKDERIEQTARRIVAAFLDIDPTSIAMESNFIDDLGADSLDTVELVILFEEELGVDIDDAQMDEMQTFGDAVRILSAA